MDAGHIAPCGLEPSNWASKAFPVLKGDGLAMRIVADFKRLNRHIVRPVWPTESSNQLLRLIDPPFKPTVHLCAKNKNLSKKNKKKLSDSESLHSQGKK